jgi:hypothetical protein
MSIGKRIFDYGDYDARRRRACERLGADNASCLMCSENDPCCLELHHIAGRAYDGRTVFLCKNHHAKASNAQKDHPAKIPGCTSPLEAMAHLLLGLGDLLNIAVDDLKAADLAELLSYVASNLHTLGHALLELAKADASAKHGGVA